MRFTRLLPLLLFVHSADAQTSAKILLVGGLDGDGAASRFVEVESKRLHYAAISAANPKKGVLSFPPKGTAYRDNPESHYLWRGIAMQAPDLVIVAGRDPGGLAEALSNNLVMGLGRIPAKVVPLNHGALVAATQKAGMSEAHRNAIQRQARTPRQIAQELTRYYGHDFDPPIYIPAMALIARVRLGETQEVQLVVAPYIDGQKNSLDHVTSSHLAGHLLFADLAEQTNNPAYVRRVQEAADLARSPSLHNEMSDSVFMSCPILAAAGKLTGDSTYFDKSLVHLRFMQSLCLRPDGLYRHSPLNNAAWGRGNAFPALGLAFALSRMPKDQPAYAPMLEAFQQHIKALAPYQDVNGMWHEVVDNPASYSEFSASAMILTAMHMGIRNGWLDRKTYQSRVEAAWRALLLRIGPDGVLQDVCESTGKQKSAEDYLSRAASFGRDARGGGMALLAATELMVP